MVARESAANSSIVSVAAAGPGLALRQVWTQNANGGLAGIRYTGLVVVPLDTWTFLLAYDRTTQRADMYSLSSEQPWLELVGSHIELIDGPWDSLYTFVLGNESYVLTYRAEDGTFGFFRLTNDLTVSRPYLVSLTRETPTQGFTTVAPVESLGAQYVLAYNADTGAVAVFNIAVRTMSSMGIPPLLVQTEWYHHWAVGWRHFAFFQFGGANFFFKINTDKLKVNIDHLRDNPSSGTVEVGSYLQEQLPDALEIDSAALVPWDHGEPYLLTYENATGVSTVYHIHADCMGWTQVANSITMKEVSAVLPYRVDGVSFVLFYNGAGT